MKIKAVLPTRGLIYAETIKGLLTNISSDNIIIVSGLSMPDCFNVGVQTAIDQGADYIWMVEEDNEFPEGILETMLKEIEKGEKIVTADYTCGFGSHINRINGEPAWCGVGCTLIAKEVFENIPKPWFEVSKHLNFSDNGFTIKEIPSEVVGNKYGGHDSLFFYTKAKPLGYKIKVIDGHFKHFRCKEVPKRELNNGQYSIYSL